MSRYIDAEWLLRFFEPYHDGYHTPLGVLRACVDDAPTIDIVRCKECKYIRIYDDDDDGTKYYYCALEDRPNRQWSVEETDFCSWADRKE